MGLLTDQIIKDTKDRLNQVFSDLEKAVLTKDSLKEPIIACCLIHEVGRLQFYSEKDSVEYAVKFNSFQLSRNLPSQEFKEVVYAPEDNSTSSLKILSYLLSDLTIAVNDNPQEYALKELYCEVVQKIALINPEISKGYVEHFNELQKNDLCSRFYKILDLGEGKYKLSSDKQ